jgi:hypothetical protein
MKEKLYFVFSLFWEWGGQCDVTGSGMRPITLKVMFKCLDRILAHMNQFNKEFYYVIIDTFVHVNVFFFLFWLFTE